MRKVRTAILISGRGSNMLALAAAAQAADYPAEICLVASNVPEALGLQKAADIGIPVIAMDHEDFKNRQEFDTALHKHLQIHNIELICCAGYMRILSPEFVEKWRDRILNIHPSLLPKHKGLHTHQRALEARDKVHGCTVHYVNEELDGGNTILQSSFEIAPSDDAVTLEQKVREKEHPLFIEALRMVASSIY